MKNESLADPLLEALAGLPPVAMRASYDRRVRQRCHDVLAERRARRQSRSARVVDAMVAAGAALYLVAVVAEAVRLWP